MKIVSWNVNGIRAVHKKGLFSPFVDQLKPDIICLQETKAQPHESPLDLSGYNEFWNSADKKGYSGTAIFSRQKPINISFGFSEATNAKYNFIDEYGSTVTEGRVITAEYDNFYLVTVYTPNAKEDLTRIPMRLQWDPAFLEHCKSLAASKPVIFCGDLNVAHTEDDLARPKENIGKKGFTDEERTGFQNFIDSGFVDTFRIFHIGNGHYSWWTNWGGARERNVGWRIDYFLVSDSIVDKVKAAQIHPDIMGSDHAPVSLEVDL